MITSRSFSYLITESEVKKFIKHHSIEKINNYCIVNSVFPFNVKSVKSEIVKTWLLNGLDIDKITDKNRNPFIFTTDNTLYFEWLKQLSKLNINALNLLKQNALFGSNEHKIKWLINEGLDVNHIDEKGRNALFFVKSVKECNILLKKGIDINVIDKEGLSVFNQDHLTPNIIKTLLQHPSCKWETIQNVKRNWLEEQKVMIEEIKIKFIFKSKKDLTDLFSNNSPNKLKRI